MTTNTDPVRAHDELRVQAALLRTPEFMAQFDPEKFARQLERIATALASAPPSAPVGVDVGLVREFRDYVSENAPGLSHHHPIWVRIADALAQQPAIGEEIMVNAAHGVFILPLQPSGLNGPRFVVHVPAPEQQPAAPSGEAVAPAEDIIERLEAERDRCDSLAAITGNSLTREREARLANYFDCAVREIRRLAALAAQQQGGRADGR